MGARREGREAAVQFLYQRDLNGGLDAASVEEFWDLRPANKKVREFGMTLAEGVLANQEAIDGRIRQSAARGLGSGRRARPRLGGQCCIYGYGPGSRHRHRQIQVPPEAPAKRPAKQIAKRAAKERATPRAAEAGDLPRAYGSRGRPATDDYST